MILDMIDSQIQDAAHRFLDAEYGAASFAEWAGQRLGVELTARDIKGASFEDAEEIVRAKAQRQLRETIRQAMEENLPADADPSEWTWQALANWANSRFELNLKEKDLKKLARTDDDEIESGNGPQFAQGEVDEFLYEKAVASLEKVDLSPAREFLLPDWGRRSLAGWSHHKFGLAIDAATWADLDRAAIVQQLKAQARTTYALKEAELPVRIALMKYLADRAQNSAPRYDREGLASWATMRYLENVDPVELQPLLRPEIEMKLIEVAHQRYEGAKLAEDLEAKLAAAGLVESHGDKNGDARHQGDTTELATWSRESLGLDIGPELLQSMTPIQLRRMLVNALDAKHRPEMREMEKAVLLQILDSSWMEHLRAMDHLRSSIGLQGYAQIDPKVEYKREGMRIFAEMWLGISDRVTDLIFRVEHFDPEFLNYLGSQWKLDRAQTIHDQAESQLAGDPVAGSVRRQQDAAISASQRSADQKREPVRNLAKKVGRNDPCPCGSGKKFKACCMRK